MKHRSWMHRAYTFVMYVLTPVILYRLAVRGLRARSYFLRWPERFGFFKRPGFDRCIWIHAVSLGEVNAALGLINALIERYPDQNFVVTTITPTGSERVVQVLGDRVFHVYLPYDLPAACERFFERVQPVLGVVMETEIWPNLFTSALQRRIPIVVANARLSDRSLKGYRPVQSLAAMALNSATYVGAQTQTDYERLRRLGGEEQRLTIIGSLKFEMHLAPDLASSGEAFRRQWGADRFVFVAASTHEDDETVLLAAFEELLRHDPTALLVIAPRHPERFQRVIARCRGMGLDTALRTVDRIAGPDHQCFVIDTMGELMRLLAAGDVAFVGGSLAYIGGHNVLEPAALGLPVLVGPHTFNFSEITELLLDRGGANRVFDVDDVSRELLRLHDDASLRKTMGQAGLDLVEESKGALARTMGLIESAFERSRAGGR